MIFALEIIGTIAFAISGAIVGIKKKMDILGVVILGTTTAVGGGIVRDLIIGITPPIAFQKPVYALIAIITSLIVFVPAIRNTINSESSLLLLFDSIGLGVFTIVGVQAGLEFNNLFLTVFLGTITGVGGGVLRDLFASQAPSIFVRHFYASACIVGALVSAIIIKYNHTIGIVLGIIITVTLRLLAAKYKWNLPRAD